jgi:hypothetical protein
VAIAQRIHETLPDAKILFVLRDLVERAISAVLHHMYNRRIPAYDERQRRAFRALQRDGTALGILDTGLYARNFEPYLTAFGEDRVRIWIYEEDIVRTPEAMLSDAFRFIGVPSNLATNVPTRPANVGMRSGFALWGHYYLPAASSLWQAVDRALPHALKIKVDANCLDRLKDYYAAENERLASILGRPLPHWQC